MCRIMKFTEEKVDYKLPGAWGWMMGSKEFLFCVMKKLW